MSVTSQPIRNNGHVSSLGTVKNSLYHEASVLRILADRIDSVADEVVDMIATCKGNVIVTAVGKSGHVGQKFASSLRSVLIRAFFIHAGEALHGDAGGIGEGDMLFVLSSSGETRECVDLALLATRSPGIPIVLLTCSPSSSLVDLSTLVIECGTIVESDSNGILPTASATAMLAVCNAMTSSLSARMEITRTEFARIHPSGGLGLRLTTLAAILENKKNQPQPVVRRSCTAGMAADTFQACQTEGHLFVVDNCHKLRGIVALQDVFSLLTRSGHRSRISDSIQDAGPTAHPTISVDEAFRLFHESGRHHLPVVDDRQTLIGVIALIDLYQFRSGCSLN